MAYAADSWTEHVHVVGTQQQLVAKIVTHPSGTPWWPIFANNGWGFIWCKILAGGMVGGLWLANRVKLANKLLPTSDSSTSTTTSLLCQTPCRDTSHITDPSQLEIRKTGKNSICGLRKQFHSYDCRVHFKKYTLDKCTWKIHFGKTEAVGIKVLRKYMTTHDLPSW